MITLEMSCSCDRAQSWQICTAKARFHSLDHEMLPQCSHRPPLSRLLLEGPASSVPGPFIFVSGWDGTILMFRRRTWIENQRRACRRGVEPWSRGLHTYELVMLPHTHRAAAIAECCVTPSVG